MHVTFLASCEIWFIKLKIKFMRNSVPAHVCMCSHVISLSLSLSHTHTHTHTHTYFRYPKVFQDKIKADAFFSGISHYHRGLLFVM